jgi:hypothetical protein
VICNTPSLAPPAALAVITTDFFLLNEKHFEGKILLLY